MVPVDDGARAVAVTPLDELCDAGALAEIATAAAALGGLGVTVCGAAGQPLAQAGEGHPGAPEACALWPEPGAWVPVQSDSGHRFVVQSIQHQAETIGTVVVGPYRPGEAGDPRLPRVSDETARALAHLIERAAAAMLASQAENFRELEDKNRRLASMLERLRELDRLKSNLLATVSHELRTPLTSVIGYSEMLLEGLAGELGPEQREYVRTIMSKGEQLLALISGMLEISRIEAGASILERTPVDLVGLVVEVVTSLRGHANRKNLTLDLEAPRELPSASLDRDKVRQAVANVLANAIKFTPPGGQVRVGMRLLPPAPARRGRTIEIVVIDTGIGIAPSALPHVFEAFYQADSSPTRQHGGTGLGLTIARSFVDAHGGSIDLLSAPGEGTTVTILLPVDPAPMRRLAPEGAP